MPRKNGRGYPRSNPQANREKRHTKLVKAFRVLNPENSSHLSGVMQDLEHDGSIPVLSGVPGVHTVYVLDPHNARKEFSSILRSGERFGYNRALRRMRDDVPEDDIIEAKVGKVSILGSSPNRRRLIAADVESGPIVEERKDLYRILGEEGLRGFTGKAYTRVGAPIIPLGTLAQPLHGQQERMKIAETIETALLIQQAIDITLGPLQIV